MQECKQNGEGSDSSVYHFQCMKGEVGRGKCLRRREVGRRDWGTHWEGSRWARENKSYQEKQNREGDVGGNESQYQEGS